jgi:hypothetical protein
MRPFCFLNAAGNIHCGKLELCVIADATELISWLNDPLSKQTTAMTITTSQSDL